MSSQQAPPPTGFAFREVDFATPADAASVARLDAEYLRRTEEEKATRGLSAYREGDPLPEPYAAEVARPAAAFAGSTVLVASAEDRDVGLAVLTPRGGNLAEIKRLWVDPTARRSGIGSALLQEMLTRGPEIVRLSVWEWRAPAIRAYERLGFTVVPSWDDRPGLVCMERSRVRA